jgi:hypothetical protein
MRRAVSSLMRQKHKVAAHESRKGTVLSVSQSLPVFTNKQTILEPRQTSH